MQHVTDPGQGAPTWLWRMKRGLTACLAGMASASARILDGPRAVQRPTAFSWGCEALSAESRIAPRLHRGCYLAITGDAGVGKSRWAMAMVRHALAEGATVVWLDVDATFHAPWAGRCGLMPHAFTLLRVHDARAARSLCEVLVACDAIDLLVMDGAWPGLPGRLPVPRCAVVWTGAVLSAPLHGPRVAAPGPTRLRVGSGSVAELRLRWSTGPLPERRRGPPKGQIIEASLRDPRSGQCTPWHRRWLGFDGAWYPLGQIRRPSSSCPVAQREGARVE